MSELNSAARVSDELIAPDAEIEQNGEDPGPGSWETGSAPSLPSVDSRRRNNDADSAIGTLSDETSTASLRSSIYQNVEENGRTYHHYKQGKYNLPNDELERERLDLQHTLFYITFGEKYYFAPLGPNIHNALDIATGTGIWAIDFANLFPNAQVVGTDLSAIQPDYIPANCRFEIDDAEDEWTFAQKFDFIHGRALLSCFKDPKFVLAQAFNSLAPGGYLEMHDLIYPFSYIGPAPVGSPVYRWNELCMEGSAKLGRPWTNVKNYKTWMEEIGYEDVVERTFYWPTNTWAKGQYLKQVGAFFHQDLLNGIEGMSLKVIGCLGWSAEQIREFLVGVIRDINDPEMTAYVSVKVVYGRKPSPAVI
ncbi:S-adenosyl-L-methionine-dependent methyltransferase [Stipitochalara longipes BDJ]|nr:S-adenosyl-L-methionine-dependent methyltransferase [Stipitochalara longipes BDJ]